MLVGLCRWIHPASGHRCVLFLVYLDVIIYFATEHSVFNKNEGGWGGGGQTNQGIYTYFDVLSSAILSTGATFSFIFLELGNQQIHRTHH